MIKLLMVNNGYGCMTIDICHHCKFSNYGSHSSSTFCGKGLKVVSGECSGYVHGDKAGPPPVLLMYTLPPLPPPQAVPGCFIPVHSVTDKYEIHIAPIAGPGQWFTSPGASALQVIGIFMYNHPKLLDAIRYRCLFDSDYNGAAYTCTVLGTKCKDSNGIMCNGFNKVTPRTVSIQVRITSSHMIIALCLTYCKGNSEALPWHQNYEYDIPPHYWWLDITTPSEVLVPMHNLIKAVYTSTNNPMEYKVMGLVLKEALELGLLLKDRPITVWHDAIGGLNINLYRRGVLTQDSRLLYHWLHYSQIVMETGE